METTKRIFTEGHHVVESGMTVEFRGNATGTVHGGEASFLGFSPGVIHGGEAWLYGKQTDSLPPAV